MSEKPAFPRKQMSNNDILACGISFGLSFGVVFGLLFDQFAIFISMGPLLGLTIALMIQEHRKRTANPEPPK